MSLTRRIASLSLGVALAAGVVGISAGPSQAFDGTFQATAAASGVRVSVVVPHAPLSDQVADFGGPVAQTVVDSIGESSGYASFPYPGAVPATSPALLRGLSGVPAPDYPMFVWSKAPANRKQEFGAGPFTLRSDSADQTSAATAAVGLDGGSGTALGRSVSHAESGALNDAVSSAANSETTGFSAGPLQIARVVSSATTTFTSDGKLTRAANTVVEGASVGGTPVAIAGPDLKGVNALLAAAKISIDFAPKQELDTGVTAPMLRITQHDDSSGATIVYQIGEASAFVDAALPPSASSNGEPVAPAGPAGKGSATGASPSSPLATAPVTDDAPVSRADGLRPAVAATAATGAETPVAVPVSFTVGQPALVARKEGPAHEAAAVAPSSAPLASPSAIDQTAARTVELAGASHPARIIPVGELLVSTSDTTPVFPILIIAALGGLTAAGARRRHRTT